MVEHYSCISMVYWIGNRRPFLPLLHSKMEESSNDEARAKVSHLQVASSPAETIAALTEISEYAKEEPFYDHQKAIIDAGGITSILDVMEVQLNAGVQAKCCSTL